MEELPSSAGALSFRGRDVQLVRKSADKFIMSMPGVERRNATSALGRDDRLNADARFAIGCGEESEIGQHRLPYVWRAQLGAADPRVLSEWPEGERVFYCQKTADGRSYFGVWGLPPAAGVDVDGPGVRQRAGAARFRRRLHRPTAAMRATPATETFGNGATAPMVSASTGQVFHNALDQRLNILVDSRPDERLKKLFAFDDDDKTAEWNLCL